MTIIYFLIAFSFLAAVTFLVFFIWAVRNGQFKDSTTPAIRMLFEDQQPTNTEPNQHGRDS